MVAEDVLVRIFYTTHLTTNYLVVKVILTSQEIDETQLAEEFYNSMRGFIVIEESGLPKYVEFLTEEEIDVILLAGLLSSLQALSEVISAENIKTIVTSNSSFVFELREKFFYVIWIEKAINAIENYDPIIMKIISRFEGASSSDIDSSLLISNLTETPEYEKLGRRLVKIRTKEARYIDAHKKLESDIKKSRDIKYIVNKLAGIDGVFIISKDNDQMVHSEFYRGEPIFDIQTLSNFIIGIRKSMKNLDPGTLEEVSTQNYRFIIRESADYFCVFEVIKGLANEEKLSKTITKLMNRYEGLRRKTSDIKILQNFDTTSEHEILGQFSMEMREFKGENGSSNNTLDRQTSKISFGDDSDKWRKEENQLYTMMDIYKEIFLVGIICPSSKFFVSRRTSDINDWMQSVKELQLNRLLNLLAAKQPNEFVKLAMGGKEVRLLKIKEQSVLLVILDSVNSAAERYLLRLPNILAKISKNIH